MPCARYRFRVESQLTFDRNVVAALFLYLDDHHEIDIEVARFGAADDPNDAQFALQPLDRYPGGYIHRFALPPFWRPSIHEIEWRHDVVHFRCVTGSGDVVAEANTTRQVPHGALKARINLWLYAGGGKSGRPLSDGCEAELVVSSFAFAPAS